MKMKENTLFFTIILLILFLAGCSINPVKMVVLTPQELCDHMNKNFDGEFELVDEEIVDSDFEKTTTAYMKCSKFPGETVIAKQGYTDYLKFGWREIKLETNYDYLYYKKDVEVKAGLYAQKWFEKYDYKFVNATHPTYVLNYEKKYDGLEQYLLEPILIGFYIVIDARDKDVKQEVLSNLESIKSRIENERDNALRFYLFLCEDNSFDSLTDEDIKKFYDFESL